MSILMLEPRIEVLAEKKLVGMHCEMSIANNQTFQLWHGFMKRRNDIQNNVSTDLYSIQVYPLHYNFAQFNAHAPFVKWAAREVSSFENIPEGMGNLLIPSSLYAVFIHKGTADMFFKTFQYIFQDWLPNSNYLLDNRPHFELLGAHYKNNDPASEEEVWIPVKLKA